MCGISGILNLSSERPIELSRLRQMTQAIRHRGPDDEGFHLSRDGVCGLGFRRLAIIDLAGGRQPLSDPGQSVWAMLNGEIYNYRELRAELAQRGATFRTQSDTEVVVQAYREFGVDCFSRLAGMFVIALWDEARRELILARDRFGKKPLCYAVIDGALHFASEAKAILALPEARRELDEQSLHRYLLFQYVPAPHSIYRGFRTLPPGHLLRVSAGADVEDLAPRAYWSLPQPARFSGSYRDAKFRLGELLTHAVERRLIADVPLGAFLSGGVDSSIVVGLMRKLGVSPLRTFSIGFEDPRYDESSHARRVAALFETEHHEQMVTPRASEVIDLLAWHYDEPFADSSAIPTWYVSRHARSSVTVALTGDAGDECFAGYDRYRAAQLAGALDAAPAFVSKSLASLAGLAPHGGPKTRRRRLYRFLSALGESPARRYLSWVTVFSPAELLQGYRPEFLGRISFDEPLEWFDGLYASGAGSAAERAARVDFQSYLPFDLLTKVDIASMACSLECRAPFLDHELVEFALSLPIEWRLGKKILRDWAADFVPRDILDRPKTGFGVPLGQWFRQELREPLESALFAEDSLCRSLFQEPWLRALLATHQQGRANHEHRLWALFMLEHWRRAWPS